MDLEFSADQEELRTSVRAVITRECPIGLVRQVVEKEAPADSLWQQMCQLDWPALTVPEEHGGMGLGTAELAVLMEETGAAIAPGPLFATAALFVPTVREAGTREQRERFLRLVAEGRLTGTLAIVDAAGWEPDDVRAVARRAGEEWELDGTKRYVIEGDAVDEVVVAARIDGSGGVGLFVVPAAGLEAAPIRTADRTRRLAALDLAGVRVPGDRLLGGGASDGALRRSLDEAATALSLELVGTCAAILTIALEYAKSREQFGVKIGSFQAMKHKLADMYVALESARATAYFAAAAVAEDDPRRSLAASMAKSLAGDCERRVAQEGIQSLGGIGYTWEHDMHLYVKRAMGSAALLGTAEDHRRRVAALLGLTG